MPCRYIYIYIYEKLPYSTHRCGAHSCPPQLHKWRGVEEEEGGGGGGGLRMEATSHICTSTDKHVYRQWCRSKMWMHLTFKVLYYLVIPPIMLYSKQCVHCGQNWYCYNGSKGDRMLSAASDRQDHTCSRHQTSPLELESMTILQARQTVI